MKKIISIFAVLSITTPALATIQANTNVASTSYVQGAVDMIARSKQDKIEVGEELDADLVDDSTSTNKFVTASDKTNWNAKQGQLVNDAVSPANVLTTVKTTVTVTPSSASDTNLVTEKAISTALEGKQATLTSTNVTTTGSVNPGAVVTSVSASSGTVTVTKSDLAVPIKSGSSYTGAVAIWIE